MINNKLGLLELSQQLGNVSRATTFQAAMDLPSSNSFLTDTGIIRRQDRTHLSANGIRLLPI